MKHIFRFSKIIFFIFVQFLLFQKISLGGDALFSNIHHHYQSPRALGMGDAFVAVANDYSAIFYNPAGLARLETGQVNMSMEFGFPQSIFDFAKSLQDAGKTDGSNNQFNAFSKVLQENYGKNYSIRTGLFQGIWVRPHWGIAVLPIEISTDMMIHNQGAPALALRAYADTTLAYGYGNDMKGYIPGRISWGITSKFITREYISKQVNALDLATSSDVFNKNELREGYALDFDLGLLFTPHLPTDSWWKIMTLAKPSFGLVLRNVFESKFNQSLGLVNKEVTVGEKLYPEPLYRVIDLGTKWEYPNIFIFGGRGVMDIRDIGHPQFSFKKGLHLGFEFDWTMFSWWKGQYRFGLSQTYLTAGLSALFSVFRLDIATYSEETGSQNTPLENRMYTFKFNIDI